MTLRLLRFIALGAAVALALSGCGFSPYSLPLPGGANLGSHPYTVTVHFRDVLDLVPQSAVRVNDVAVGKVRKIKLDGWTAVVTLQINRDAKLPDNAEATIRQTSLLGEKFVSLAAPATGGHGRLGNGDVIPLERSGRNPEIEEVLGAASLLFNGGGLEKTNTIVRELNKALGGNEGEVRDLLDSASSLITQLDDNKRQLITTLEKVNNLAIATNKQKDAITGALDNLPGALTVVNQEREDIVKLLEALDHLGDVGTRVVRDSKADIVADLKALQPILRNLADSGDSLTKSLSAALTYPFTDGLLNNSVEGAHNFHTGDYVNLAITTNLTLDNLGGLLGQTDLGDALDNLGGSQADAGDSAGKLADLVGGLVGTGLPDPADPVPGATTSPKTPAPSPADPKLPTLCALLGGCPVSPQDSVDAPSNDLGRLLTEPVVPK